jgi:hypothetical protein
MLSGLAYEIIDKFALLDPKDRTVIKQVILESDNIIKAGHTRQLNGNVRNVFFMNPTSDRRLNVYQVKHYAR